MLAARFALLAAALQAAACSHPSDDLIVRRLVIRDNAGRDRIVVAVEDGGTPVIRLMDDHAVARIAITVKPDGSGAATLSLCAKDGSPALAMGEVDGNAGLQILERNRRRLELFASRGDAGWVVNGGPDARPRQFTVSAVCSDAGSDLEVSSTDEVVRVRAPGGEGAQLHVETPNGITWQAPKD
jgi:hypothetical protein